MENEIIHFDERVKRLKEEIKSLSIAVSTRPELLGQLDDGDIALISELVRVYWVFTCA